MPMLKTLATGLAGRSAGKRLGRAIPNPLLRFVVVTAATALAPMVARKLRSKWEQRQIDRAEPRLVRG